MLLDAAASPALPSDTRPDYLRCGRVPKPQSPWAVIHTHPQAEHWACANLNRIGYTTYLPRYAAHIHDRTIQTITRIVQRPLFPSYAFVRINHSPWIPIRYTPGVHSLLMDGAQPGMARAGAVEALQAGDEARRYPTAQNARWAPGMPCSLATGAFAGHPAVVTAIKRNLATLNLIMLGELRTVSIGVECLTPRNPTES